MALFRRPYDGVLLDLVEGSGRNVVRSATLLRDLLADWPERPELATALVDCEHEGDRIAHDIIDDAEQTADMLGLYRVEATMEHGSLLAEVLLAAGEQVAGALRALRAGADMMPFLVEIHRLENEGDRLSRDAIASLFVAGIDPMVVIRWKDIFESLEAAIDACEHVAHVLEGIGIKRRR